MKVTEKLEKVLRSFERYYDLNRQSPTPPFSAEASFKSSQEQYVLVKSARISESESNEYVFFYAADELTPDCFSEIELTAWETGLSRVTPHFSHRNSDVTLIIIANHLDTEIQKKIKKTNHFKSYAFTLKGWSRFRIIAAELSTGRFFYNRFGKEFKKILAI